MNSIFNHRICYVTSYLHLIVQLIILHYCTLSEVFSAVAELDDGFRARPGFRAPIVGRAVAGLYHLTGFFRGGRWYVQEAMRFDQLMFFSSSFKYTIIQNECTKRFQRWHQHLTISR